MFVHIAAEVAKNVVKGAFPNLVTRLRGHTGRGKGRQSPQEIAEYGRSIFTQSLADIGVREPEGWVSGRTIVELGPGDTLATGMLFAAYGAKRYIAVDRFSFQLESELNRQVYAALLPGLAGEPKSRLERHLAGTRGYGVDGKAVQILREPAESFELDEPADMVLSQSVLEHVVDLPSVFSRMAEALRTGGWMAHGVDLADHGLYPGQPFRFLEYSPRLWSAMHRFRGSPNRRRVNEYRELCAALGLEWSYFKPGTLAAPEAVAAARPRLHESFRKVSDADLRVLDFRFAARKT